MALLARNSRGIHAIATLVLAMTVALFGVGPAVAQAPLASREAVYAAFTVNLTRFISWPENSLGPANAPFLIGTFPRDPINEELDAAVRGEEVAGHPIQTIRLRSLDDVRKCHVVFMTRGVADPATVLVRTEHHPVLTISDADGFLNLGGHVRFVPQPTRTGLQISANNLRASGLEARAQLLRIASTP
jgi:hypothetical protein